MCKESYLAGLNKHFTQKDSTWKGRNGTRRNTKPPVNPGKVSIKTALGLTRRIEKREADCKGKTQQYADARPIPGSRNRKRSWVKRKAKR
jgi:hypothetical protein